MSDWPFEPVVEAKRRLDGARVLLMRSIASWTSGTVSYDEVEATFATFETHLAVLKALLHAMRDTPGSPRVAHGRFDANGNVTATRILSGIEREDDDEVSARPSRQASTKLKLAR